MSIREASCLNIVLQAGEEGQGGGDTSGQLNVFIPERQMSLDQAILQGEKQSLVELTMKVREDFTITVKLRGPSFPALVSSDNDNLNLLSR